MVTAAARVVLSGWTSAPRRYGASALLLASVRLATTVMVTGQALFVWYIALFYDVAALRGDFVHWSANTHLLNGYVPGDTIGNLAFGAHVLLAAVVTLGGALQLSASVRERVAVLHRWNGRLFVATAIALALNGLCMIWIRGSRANALAGAAASADALLIIAFASLALRCARARAFAAHRRWALRTWIVANALWFQRVGIFAWCAFLHAPVGMTLHFDGWFDRAWAFGCYLLPLGALELYLRARDRAGPRSRLVLAGAMLVLSAVMAYGIRAAWISLWGPASSLSGL